MKTLSRLVRLVGTVGALCISCAAQIMEEVEVPQDGWSALKDFLAPSSNENENDTGDDPFRIIHEHGKRTLDNVIHSVSSSLSRFFQEMSTSDKSINDADSMAGDEASTEAFPIDPIEELLSKVIGTVSYKEEPESLERMLNVLWTTFKKAEKQLEDTFSNLSLSFHPLQLYYFMIETESRLHPIFKQRQHAWMNPVPESVLHALSDGLYLSHLAYVDDCVQIGNYLKEFHNNSWGMMNCTTTSKPSQPAHFVAIRKVSTASWETLRPVNILDRIGEFFSDKQQALEVAIVVRGTKEISDMLSDALLEAVDYRGGKSHNGILDSAKFLKALYEPVLENLLEFTGQSKIKLWIIGHSLGGGTAALTALEFLEDKRVDVHALGFGSPPVVSKEIEYPKNIITTVINDADFVPRLSGPTMVEAAVKLDNFPWLSKAKEDLLFLKTQKLPFKEITDSLIDTLLKNLESEEPVSPPDFKVPEPVLIPPGNCIHLYRDNLNWQAVYMDCELFNSIQTVRNMLGDHLIPTGYYRGILENLRRIRQDYNFALEPNLMNLPVPLPPKFVAA